MKTLALALVLALSSGCCSWRVFGWESQEPEAYANRPTCADLARWAAMPFCRGCGGADPQCLMAIDGARLCAAEGLPPEATP